MCLLFRFMIFCVYALIYITVPSNAKRSSKVCHYSAEMKQEWNPSENSFFIIRFFLPPRRWNASTDTPLRFSVQGTHLDLDSKNTTFVYTPLEGADAVMADLAEDEVFLQNINGRIGWNLLALVWFPVRRQRRSLTLHINDIRTKVQISDPNQTITVTTEGMTSFLDCGKGDTQFYRVTSSFESFILPFFWEEESGEQRIWTDIVGEDLLLSSYPGGKELKTCQKNRTYENWDFYLMRECPVDWTSVSDVEWMNIHLSGSKMNKQDYLSIGDYGFMEVNVTFLGETEDFLDVITSYQHPVDVFYKDVFIQEVNTTDARPKKKAALFAISIAVPLSIIVISLATVLTWIYCRNKHLKEKNVNIEAELKQSQKEVKRLASVWYVNKFPGEIKLLIDDMKLRKGLSENPPIHAEKSEEPEVIYDNQFSNFGNSGTNSLKRVSVPEGYYEEFEFQPTPVALSGKRLSKAEQPEHSRQDASVRRAVSTRNSNSS